MVRQNPKQLYRIPVDMLRHQVREREGEREPASTPFDGHFPEAGNTEQPFVGAILNELPRIGTEGRITANKPEKRVRIE
jgi:hypothetical protein